jgi:hypothetical protein
MDSIPHFIGCVLSSSVSFFAKVRLCTGQGRLAYARRHLSESDGYHQPTEPPAYLDFDFRHSTLPFCGVVRTELWKCTLPFFTAVLRTEL